MNNKMKPCFTCYNRQTWKKQEIKAKLPRMGLLLHYTDIVLTSGGISSCFNTKKNLFLTNKGGGGVDSPERLLLLPDQFFCLNFLEYAVMSSNINIIFSDWLTFDGIHPTFKQVPPNDFSFSTQTVCKTKELKPCKAFCIQTSQNSPINMQHFPCLSLFLKQFMFLYKPSSQAGLLWWMLHIPQDLIQSLQDQLPLNKVIKYHSKFTIH